MPPPVRVVIAEDDVLLREGIVRLLAEAGFEVVGQAGDAEDFLRKALAHRPDVDIEMPPWQGPTAYALRSICVPACRPPACWCSPATSRRSTPWI